MRYKTSYSLQAQVVNYNGAITSSDRLTRKLDGLACHSDSVLNYTELIFAKECGLRGGHPRLVQDEKGRLTMTVEVDSQRRLSRNELIALREDFEGQLTDGIGAGCFDRLTTATSLAVELRFPLRSKCAQTEGTAWRPKASTEKGNEQRIAAAAKLVERMDSAPSKTGAARRPTTDGTSKVSPPNKQKLPNLKKLFRILAKLERDQYFDQIKAELEASGDDLSMVGDGVYPSGNFNDPKLVRLLLKAGLPPETKDVNGNSLLIQAVVNPKCVELFLKEGVSVNRVCDGSFGTTALIRAASLGERKSVEVLLAHGADPMIKNKAGKTAADVVDKRSRERQRIIDLLRPDSGT